MDQDFPESSLNGKLQTKSLRGLELDRMLNQSPESPKLDQDLRSSPDQVQVQDKDSTQDEVELDPGPPEPSQDQLEEQGQDQNPTEDDGDQGRPAQDQDLLRAVQRHDQDLDRVSPQDQDRAGRQGDHDQDRAGRQGDQDQDRARHQGGQDQDRARHQGDQDRDQEGCQGHQDQDRAGSQGHQDQDMGGDSVPALVIIEVEQALGSEPTSLGGRVVTPAHPVMDPGLSSSSDQGEMTCSDLLSLRSDSFCLMSELAVCRTSEDDDSRSVTASSVMSLFHRVQLDPLEKFWLRSSAVGNMAAQRQLLSQDPSLVFKKTALHWAAKQGRQDLVDLMLHSGANVNARSGYTALHLASIHGHQHVVHALINTYNAKTTIRDYHGKMANQYASCSDNKAEVQSGGRRRGRQSQRSVLPSLLSRSRSQGQLNLDFVMMPQSLDGLDF